METDKEDNVIVAGRHENGVVFNAADASKALLHNGPEYWYYHFVAKYSSDGRLLWVQDVYNIYSNMTVSYIYNSCTDKAGNIYISGALGATTVFTSTSGKRDTIKPLGYSDYRGYIAKYSPEGEFLDIVQLTDARHINKMVCADNGILYAYYDVGWRSCKWYCVGPT